MHPAFLSLTLGAVAFRARAPCAGSRSGPIVAQQQLAAPTLERQGAPPGSGGGSRGGGGGGDGGGDGAEWLRLLEETEVAEVLDDWQARSRIYAMTDDAAIQQAHRRAVDSVESMRSFRLTPGELPIHCSERETPKRMILGACAHD